MPTDPLERFPVTPTDDIREISCSGTPREMGMQQGQALGDRVAQGLREVVLENPRIRQIKPWFVPARLLLRVARGLAKRNAPRDVELHYPRQYDRTIGIAKGAGVDVDLLWLMAFLEQQTQPALRLPACTSVAFGPDRTALGEAAIARVFDLPPETKPFNLLRRDAPTGRYASLHLTFPQLAGSHTGVNQQGLAVSYNLGYPSDRSDCRTNVTLIVQEVFERCATVGEALELVPQLPRSGGSLLTLADAAGDIAAVELTSTRTAGRRPEHGCIVNTNHYQHEHTRPMETGFGEHARFWQRRGWRWIGPSSRARLDRARELLRGRSQWGIEDMIALMADHGASGVGSDMTICRHPPPYETTLAAVLLPARRAILLAPGQACCCTFVCRPMLVFAPESSAADA